MLCALQVEEAGHVFLLMKKDYRISRNVRLAWVLSRLHQVIWAVPEPELVSGGRGSAAGVDGSPSSQCVFWLGVMSLACRSLLVAVEVRKRAGCAQHPAQRMAAG